MTVSCYPHTVRFPDDHAVGNYTIVDCRYQLDWMANLWPYVKGDIPSYLEGTAGEARGEVVVPQGMGLYLWFPTITSANIEALTALRPDDVQFLDLDNHDRLDEALLAPIEHLTGLLKVDLDDTVVGDAGVLHLRPLTNVRILNLTMTGIGDVGLEAFEEMHELQVLQLGWAETTGAGFAHLGGLRHLKVLNLYRTRFADSGLLSLAAFPDLRLLNLARTQVTDAGMVDVGRLRSLQVLSLAGTAISDAGLASLAGLQHLVCLNLAQTNVTEVGYDWIKQQLPACAIIRSDAVGWQG
jgi:Leucine Rich repeat